MYIALCVDVFVGVSLVLVPVYVQDGCVKYSLPFCHVKCLYVFCSQYALPAASFTSGPDVVSREEELVRSEIIKMLQSDCPPEEVCQIFNAYVLGRVCVCVCTVCICECVYCMYM